jgi:hypothetical protein
MLFWVARAGLEQLTNEAEIAGYCLRNSANARDMDALA